MHSLTCRGILVLTAVTLVTPSVALAWASTATPICQTIHQDAIENVFQTYVGLDHQPLPPAALAILQEQQKVIDRHQAPSQSSEHAMTGVERGETPAQRRAAFIAGTEKFLHDQLNAAIAARNAGRDAGWESLGQAIHPLQDATSPAHRPFQAWRYNETWFSMAVHVWKESQYPEDEGDTAPLRADLENAVRWALDIYFEKTPLPDHFFKSDGELDFPPAYRSATAVAHK